MLDEWKNTWVLMCPESSSQNSEGNVWTKLPLEAPQNHPTSPSATQSPDLLQPGVIRCNPLPESHPAAKPLVLDTEEGNFNTLIGKNPFSADLQLFTSSSVSVLTHRGLLSTSLTFNKFLQQQKCRQRLCQGRVVYSFCATDLSSKMRN